MFIRMIAVASLAVVSAGALLAAQTPPKADPQMQAVLDQLARLGPKPIEKLSPEEARQQPTPADAVMALLKSQNKSTAPEPVGNVENKTFPAGADQRYGGRGGVDALSPGAGTQVPGRARRYLGCI